MLRRVVKRRIRWRNGRRRTVRRGTHHRKLRLVESFFHGREESNSSTPQSKMTSSGRWIGYFHF